MKGLELAADYFTAYGQELIQRYGPVSYRIAAGMAGPGSECFGFDDEFSRDHDWGPGFCLWLTDADYDEIGAELAKGYATLPKTFNGYGPRVASRGEEYRVGVSTISNFYRIYTGLDHPPKSEEEWTGIPENNLALCTNGRVFYDPLGEFSKWREELLEYYPEPVRRKKIAYYAFLCGQSGQYNLWRAALRNQLYTERWAETRFCIDSLRLMFLLNKRYAPFDKWLFHAARGLPILGEEFVPLLEGLLSAADMDTKKEVVEKMARLLIDELRRQKISTSSSEFLLDHSDQIREA